MNVYYHYVKDHLGNICAVVNSTADTLVQSTIYYPSGVPMAQNLGPNVTPSYYNALGLQYTKNFGRDEQPYLYNGKEFIEAHGLNEYDSQARMYYAPIMRTTTMDPLAEKYYHISPYAWCGNNPIGFVDLDGKNVYLFDSVGNYTGEMIEQDGEHIGRILNNDGRSRDFKFINQSDADRLGDDYNELYIGGYITKDQNTNPLTGVVMVSNKQINQLMLESYAFPYPHLISLIYAFIESRGRRLDFTTFPNSVIDVYQRDKLYLPESSDYAHDSSNFGNFLWGRAMASMGIYYPEAVIGSHFHNLFYSIVNTHTIEFDSLDDQKSILMGYYYNLFKQTK